MTISISWTLIKINRYLELLNSVKNMKTPLLIHENNISMGDVFSFERKHIERTKARKGTLSRVFIGCEISTMNTL